jgi:two-component system, cell cycle sensor histidine kinase and response regulator CckA
MTNGKIKILLIEDNPGDARLVQEMLRDTGSEFQLGEAPDLATGVAELEREDADLVLLDLGLPDSQGLDGIATLVDRFPELPVVVLTGLNDQQVGFAAVRAGAQDFLSKEEVTGPTLLRTINYAIERQRLKSELRRATCNLQLSENRLRQLVEENSDGMLIINSEGLVRLVNPAAEALLGRRREEILDKPFGYELAAKGTTELSIPHDNGRVAVCELRRVTTEWHGEEVVFASLRDITERRLLERQLRHTQKMDALGNLTRGIAHDFNNILAAIIGYASVLEMKTDGQPPLQSPVRQILAAADRASTLTRALLSFSRSQPGEMRPLDLLEVVTRIGQVLPSLLGGRITLLEEHNGGSLPIKADPVQLEQILFNLAANAREAMPEGGTCTLSTDHQELTAEFRQRHGFGRPGRYARIALTDTGIGMDSETCEKIFEPFFTTRQTGDGTGLGLAIAYGIVKQHRGFILCHSAPSAGSTFEILLPLITEAPAGIIHD